jgi:hypothetical protein
MEWGGVGSRDAIAFDSMNLRWPCLVVLDSVDFPAVPDILAPTLDITETADIIPELRFESRRNWYSCTASLWRKLTMTLQSDFIGDQKS